MHNPCLFLHRTRLPAILLPLTLTVFLAACGAPSQTVGQPQTGAASAAPASSSGGDNAANAVVQANAFAAVPASNAGPAPAASGGASDSAAFGTYLPLPDGQVATPDHPVHWQGLQVSLQVQGLPPEASRDQQIVGNHAEIRHRSEVTTGAGPGVLLEVDRTTPAAQTPSTTKEWWVVVYRPTWAYAIVVTGPGDPNAIRSQVIDLARRWHVPG
ncbi:MAG: hypothetical protein K6T81_17245 [Alicyclobacillus macrosporangiidus]|uniref:hypothetical protein n=1 Tax=Alicyclobacillus macrosporangiidus TaxID=392015 RepID=UPI0026EAEA31|nr:hypothetical protein [Alicyclobacillus macrosporangiidus]MCL6600459.1 hypothetical protein [Alicyclobacillus macrosporangiidus]